MTSSERFRLMRLKAGHTQLSLGETANPKVSRSAISAIEGNGKPNTNTVIRALGGIKKTMEDLYKDKVPEKFRSSENKDIFDKLAELLEPDSGRSESITQSVEDAYTAWITEMEKKIGTPSKKGSQKS